MSYPYMVYNLGTSLGCWNVSVPAYPLLSVLLKTSEARRFDISRCEYEVSLETYFGRLNLAFCVSDLACVVSL